jgi:hypothetical protein
LIGESKTAMRCSFLNRLIKRKQGTIETNPGRIKHP